LICSCAGLVQRLVGELGVELGQALLRRGDLVARPPGIRLVRRQLAGQPRQFTLLVEQGEP
jgi:hypothetical protein